MSLIISKRPEAGQLQYRMAFGFSEIFGVGIAILNPGEELLHIAPNKDEFHIAIEQIHSAKANRDRYIRDGIRYEPLPTLEE